MESCRTCKVIDRVRYTFVLQEQHSLTHNTGGHDSIYEVIFFFTFIGRNMFIGQGILFIVIEQETHLGHCGIFESFAINIQQSREQKKALA